MRFSASRLISGVADVAQHQLMPVHQVHHASDGADDHLAALLQLRHLVANGRAAEHRHHLDAAPLAVGPERLRHLDAELARRSEHQRLHLVHVLVHVLEQRQAERRGLARAGLRLPDHVVPREQLRDRLLLDRGGRLVPEVIERVEQGLREAQLGKGGHRRGA
jgi:hypothetical protein